MIFYNLAEFAFEHLRDSRRILAPVAGPFFFSNCFWQHDRTFTSILLALLLPSRSHCFFFDTTNRYEVFLARPKSHSLRTETKCRKLSPEGFCEIPPQKQSWGRQPPMKDKGKIGLDREELARGETTLWMKWYYLNIYFTHAESQVQLVFIVFELFSVDRRSQSENYTAVWSKIICFVLFEMNCISVAGVWFTTLSGVCVSLSRQVSDYRR